MGQGHGQIEDRLARAIGLDTASVGTHLIERAVETRMSASGVDDLAEFVRLLDGSEEELQALVEEVVVPESWFFRDSRPFEVLGQHARARRARDPSSPSLARPEPAVRGGRGTLLHRHDAHRRRPASRAIPDRRGGRQRPGARAGPSGRVQPECLPGASFLVPVALLPSGPGGVRPGCGGEGDGAVPPGKPARSRPPRRPAPLRRHLLPEFADLSRSRRPRACGGRARSAPGPVGPDLHRPCRDAVIPGVAVRHGG